MCSLPLKLFSEVSVAATAFKAEWQNRGQDCVRDLYMLTGHSSTPFRDQLHTREDQKEEDVVVPYNILKLIDDVLGVRIKKVKISLSLFFF